MLTRKDFAHKVLLVPVNRCWDKPGLSHLDAARYSWIVSKTRVDVVEYVMAVRAGEIVGAFEPERDGWMEAKKENFPEISDDHGNWKNQEWRPGHWRLGFRGNEAPDEVQRQYVGQMVSRGLRGQGVRYVGTP